MKASKTGLILAGLLTTTQFLPIYYNSAEFSYFVQREAARTRSESDLKQSLLKEAKAYSLPVKESDISIERTDGVLRVTVDYKVPVHLLVFNPELKFRAIGAGSLSSIK